MALTKEQILEKVKAIVVEELVEDPADVTDDTDVMADLGAIVESIAYIMKAVEDEFGIHIPDEDWEHFKTVKGAADYIFNHQ